MPKKTTKKAAKEKPLDKSYCAFFDEYKLGTNIVGCAHPDDGGFIADDLCRKCTKRQRPVSLSMKRAIDANPEGAAKFAEGLFPPKKPVKKKTAKKTTKAKRESPEVMKQRQLDAAYSLRNELQERIRKFTDDISPAKKGIAEETNLQRSIETLLYDPLYAPDESEPPKENEIVKKFLVSRLESSVGTTEALKGQLSEIAKITADDRMKLKKVNERIHRLHTVGPDPQQEFDMEDEQ